MSRNVAGSLPGRGCTDMFCASGAQGVLSCKGSRITDSQVDLPSLTPLSVADVVDTMSYLLGNFSSITASC